MLRTFVYQSFHINQASFISIQTEKNLAMAYPFVETTKK